VAAPPPPPAQRGGPSARWIVAGVATLLVLVAAIAVVWFAGRSTAPAATSYLPPETLGYVEMRLDLPGSQREKAAEFLAHFPGFADRAALEAKLDDTLDRLVRQATDQTYSYTGELKPWFNGQISLAVIDIPIPEPGANSPEPPKVAVLLGVKDRQKAQEVIDRLSADAREKGARLTSEAYAGTTIWTVEPPGPAPDEEEPTPSAIPEMPDLEGITTGFALTDDVLILATPASEVKTALDQRASGGGLADSEAYRTATAGLPADRIGAFFFGTQSLRQLLEESAEDADVPPGTTEELLRSFPESLVGIVQLESDRLIAEIRADMPEGADPVELRESGLAARVPAETAIFVELPSVGESIGKAVEQIKKDPRLGEDVTASLEQVEALLGAKLEDYLDWVGDAAIVVQFDGEQPSGGLVATVSDEAMATQRLDQLSALLRLGGASMGGGVVVGSEEYAGTTITTVTVDASMTGVEAAGEAVGEVGVSWAIKDDVFVLSPDVDYLKGILDGPEGSLADSQRFRDALASVGGPSTAGLSYLDVAAVRSAVEGVLPPDDSDRYEREIQPYVEPLDIIISAYVAEEGVDVFNRTLLIVKSQE
jgi:hypothetical protein